ncbi:MAG TPA: ZIP family metal transporter [Stellaceae bacterium]|nr:ZIP family metal transporter [Stellaceae bacterium]
MAVLVSLAAALFTLAGGVFALKFERRLALVLGFSAGAVLGVAFFDLLPESIDLAGASWGATRLLAMTALGYAAYLGFHRTAKHFAKAGALGALTLSIHSFLDGLSIGLSFQVSLPVGLVVTAGVVVHDLCDGINTVTVVRRNGGQARTAFRWLAVDAVAPILGAIAGTSIRLSEVALGVALALFGGFFLHIGASDLMPGSAQPGSGLMPAAMSMLGLGVLYAAVRLASL